MNCLSRLWWAGRITYDASNSRDPFEHADLITERVFASTVFAALVVRGLRNNARGRKRPLSNGRPSRQSGGTPHASCLLRPRALRGMSPDRRLTRISTAIAWHKRDSPLCATSLVRGVLVVSVVSWHPSLQPCSLKSGFARKIEICAVFECQIPTRRISHPTAPQVRWGENATP